MPLFNPSAAGGIYTTIFDDTLEAEGNFDVTLISNAFDWLEGFLYARSTLTTADFDFSYCYANNDTTATNYRNTRRGAGATLETNEPRMMYMSTDDVGAQANTLSVVQFSIFNYTNTTATKNLFSAGTTRRTPTIIYSISHAWNWESTAAINQLTFQPDGYDTEKFAIGSRLVLLGATI